MLTRALGQGSMCGPLAEAVGAAVGTHMPPDDRPKEAQIIKTGQKKHRKVRECKSGNHIENVCKRCIPVEKCRQFSVRRTCGVEILDTDSSIHISSAEERNWCLNFHHNEKCNRKNINQDALFSFVQFRNSCRDWYRLKSSARLTKEALLLLLIIIATFTSCSASKGKKFSCLLILNLYS